MIILCCAIYINNFNRCCALVIYIFDAFQMTYSVEPSICCFIHPLFFKYIVQSVLSFAEVIFELL